MPKFMETLYDAYGQAFRIDERLHEVKTDYQHLIIFQNALYGRVMVLDGVIQTTERDEFIYHEMMTHVPIFAFGQARRVLIIGGGDGGMLREVTRHREVEQITLVEIDRQVIDMCRTYLPKHSQGAFDDPRVHVVIEDGINYVRTTHDRFDVIISDSTDPIGPGEALFKEDFYAHCKSCLTPGGLLVTQNGVAFMQLDEVKTTSQRLSRVFEDCYFYTAAVPTYIGGVMAFAWATDNRALRDTDIETLKERFQASGIETRYYNPEIHRAAFALPQYVRDAV